MTEPAAISQNAPGVAANACTGLMRTSPASEVVPIMPCGLVAATAVPRSRSAVWVAPPSAGVYAISRTPPAESAAAAFRSAGVVTGTSLISVTRSFSDRPASSARWPNAFTTGPLSVKNRPKSSPTVPMMAARLPSVAVRTNSRPSRSTTSGTVSPGREATSAPRSPRSRTGSPSTDSTRSPGNIPAASAAEPGTTVSTDHCAGSA